MHCLTACLCPGIDKITSRWIRSFAGPMAGRRSVCCWMWIIYSYIYRCFSSAVIVTDDTAAHPSDQCFDSTILAKQATVRTVIDITDWSSVPTAHQPRPAVPDDWVSVAQQTPHLQIMGLDPVCNSSTPLLNGFLLLNGLVQKQAKGNTLPVPKKTTWNTKPSILVFLISNIKFQFSL